MGLAKANLPFGSETMLERVVRLVGKVCDAVVVVAAQDQTLPRLPVGTIVTHDRVASRGPLAGLAAGLAALPDGTEAAYVTGCDAPRLQGAFVQRMFELLGDDAIAVPVSGGFQHPLAAVYRPSLRELVEELLAADRLRPAFLFDCVATRRVSEAELRVVDPELATLENVNRPAEYLAALARAGCAAPPEILEKLQACDAEVTR